MMASPDAQVRVPPHLENTVRINWHLSSWCNYSCEYCTVQVFHQRSKTGKLQAHSFDYRPVQDWLDAIGKLQYDHIHLAISGGEPFLDRRNFRELLAGLGRMPHVRVEIATNGHWDPDYFDGVDKSRVYLVVAWHPSEVSLEDFHRNVKRIRDCGFHVWMVNFVLAPGNTDRFDEVFHSLEDDGFFVNVSAMIPAGVYMSRTQRTERELDLLERYNTPLDNYFKVAMPKTKGRLCVYPAMTYSIMYDGSIRRACLDGTAQNFFTDGIPAPLRYAARCEYERCPGCSEMYRGLVDEPMIEEPLRFVSKEDYVRDAREARKEYARSERLRSLPFGAGKLFDRGKKRIPLRQMLRESERAEASAAPSLVTLGSAVPAAARLPEQAIFGHNDHSTLTARSRDRISISGWAATLRHGAPVHELRVRIAGHEVGTFRNFFERPDIAATYGRPDLLRCGWRGMVYLPALRQGEYDLVPEAYDREGNFSALNPTKVMISD
jgi:organic radical activating enzyme